MRRGGVWLLIGAAWSVGCAYRAEPDALPASSGLAVKSPPIDRLFLFVRDTPRDDVELTLIRDAGKSTVTLIRPARPGRPRVVLDSIGPGENDAEMVVAMLDSFDVWALNAPDAPGAACKTRNGRRSCSITFNDYSLVMKVESGGETRVQRYTHLELRTSNRSARALGDFVFAWVRKREGRGRALLHSGTLLHGGTLLHSGRPLYGHPPYQLTMHPGDN
jgi:hypothetical protein